MEGGVILGIIVGGCGVTKFENPRLSVKYHIKTGKTSFLGKIHENKLFCSETEHPSGM
jgi:hypothetical protein